MKSERKFRVTNPHNFIAVEEFTKKDGRLKIQIHCKCGWTHNPMVPPEAMSRWGEHIWIEGGLTDGRW